VSLLLKKTTLKIVYARLDINMKNFYALLFSLTCLVSCNKQGCTEQFADNFNEKATEDDGSCTYADGPYSYMLNPTITISSWTADMYGPLYGAEFTISFHNHEIAVDTAEAGPNINFVLEPVLFLASGIKGGESFTISASAYGMSGSKSVVLSLDDYIDVGMIMVN
jgi:Tfp pilus assembly protein PilX